MPTNEINGVDSSRRVWPKPSRKANLIHQQILAGLIDTKPVTWTRKHFEGDDLVKTKVTSQGLANPLAQNVSPGNVEQVAKRWMR